MNPKKPTFLLLLMMATLLALGACAPSDPPTIEGEPAVTFAAAAGGENGAEECEHHAGHDDAGLPADEPAAFSVYHAASVWTDQDGERRPLDSLAGRIQVVGMVYTSCGDACPRMLVDMKRIEGELANGLQDRVGFVLVTLDPERDTPERLAEYAQGARLTGDRWTLLHGDPGDILELAALLGVQYRRLADGEFVHSNLLTVLDAEGQVVHRQVGLGADPTPTLDVIRALTD
jgi:protein SCO1